MTPEIDHICLRTRCSAYANMRGECGSLYPDTHLSGAVSPIVQALGGLGRDLAGCIANKMENLNAVEDQS
jgi:hypothetical protein